MATEDTAAETEGATRAEYQVALEGAKAALMSMEKKRDDPATPLAMRALYHAEIERLEAQIKEMVDALEDYLSPEKFKERETAREQTCGKVLMDTVREGNETTTSVVNFVRKRAGDRAWLFEEAELEADGYEKFATPEGKTVWRQKQPTSAY